MHLRPDNWQDWGEEFSVFNVIRGIYQNLRIDWGPYYKDAVANYGKNKESFIKATELKISVSYDTDILIINEVTRKRVTEILLEQGWKDVRFEIVDHYKDDLYSAQRREEDTTYIQPLTERQIKIMLGEIQPDEYEREITGSWFVFLKK